MKSFLIFLALMVLFSVSVNGQTTPTEEDQCISDALVTQISDFNNDCGNVNLSDLSSLCNAEACFRLVSRIYDGCGNNVLNGACGSGSGSGGSLTPTEAPPTPTAAPPTPTAAPPTPDQLQCIASTSTAQGLDIGNDCASADLIDLSSFCFCGTCGTRLFDVYNDSCGFDAYSECDGGDRPTEGQSHCIYEAYYSLPFDNCVSRRGARGFCNCAPCFSRASSIYSSCNFTVVCESFSRGTPDRGPTPDQDRCINDAYIAQNHEIANDCSDIIQFEDICTSGACYTRISGIENGCGYNGLSTVCAARIAPLTEDQLRCIRDEAAFEAPTILAACGGVDLSDVRTLNGVCLDVMSDIYDTCNYTVHTLTIIPSKPLSVLLGDYISLNCSSTPSADVDISYTWTHLNTSTVLEETSNILTFPRISLEELGTYLCSAPTAVSLAGAEVTITSARPLIETDNYPAKTISGSCSSPQSSDDVIVDVLQLLSAQFGVHPLGLTMSYSAESCDQVAEANPNSPPGMYWIYSDGNPVQVLCQF